MYILYDIILDYFIFHPLFHTLWRWLLENNEIRFLLFFTETLNTSFHVFNFQNYGTPIKKLFVFLIGLSVDFQNNNVTRIYTSRSQTKHSFSRRCLSIKQVLGLLFPFGDQNNLLEQFWLCVYTSIRAYSFIYTLYLLTVT